MGEEEAAAAANAVRSGWIVQGPLVAQFEVACAERLGVRHAVAVTNCTSALHVALLCANIGPGDDVLVPSFSFIASANAVLHAGATPIFIDIDPRTYNLDPTLLASTLTPQTKAIVSVDQIGLSADHDAILAFAAQHNLAVIEDAAPAIGATYKGRNVGAISPITCFSFHPRKSISTGEGGLITTDSDEIAARARVLRSHGASVSDLARHKSASVLIEAYEEVGYNYRMTDIQAAVGIEQLKKLDYVLSRRRALAARYADALATIPGVTPPYVPTDCEHTYQSYAVRLAPWLDRDTLMALLLERGVASRRGVMAIHESAAYAHRPECSPQPLEQTEAATRETLLLPIYTTMTDDEQDYVLDALSASLTAFGEKA